MRRSQLVILVLLVAVVSAGARTSVVAGEKAEKCKVHGEKLKEDSVPIIYGLPEEDRERDEAEAKYFPNARTRVIGGCEVWEGMPLKAQVRYCEKCREAESEWLKKRREKTEEKPSERKEQDDAKVSDRTRNPRRR